jgi:hypothetical protein
VQRRVTIGKGASDLGEEELKLFQQGLLRALRTFRQATNPEKKQKTSGDYRESRIAAASVLLEPWLCVLSRGQVNQRDVDKVVLAVAEQLLDAQVAAPASVTSDAKASAVMHTSSSVDGCHFIRQALESKLQRLCSLRTLIMELGVFPVLSEYARCSLSKYSELISAALAVCQLHQRVQSDSANVPFYHAEVHKGEEQKTETAANALDVVLSSALQARGVVTTALPVEGLTVVDAFFSKVLSIIRSL